MGARTKVTWPDETLDEVLDRVTQEHGEAAAALVVNVEQRRVRNSPFLNRTSGEGPAVWLPQRRQPRASAPLCPHCRRTYVIAPGDPCEVCWEELRFEDEPNALNDAEWPWLSTSNHPSGSYRQVRL